MQDSKLDHKIKKKMVEIKRQKDDIKRNIRIIKSMDFFAKSNADKVEIKHSKGKK